MIWLNVCLVLIFFSLSSANPSTFTLNRNYDWKADRFNCGDGKTIPQRYVCDGDEDCTNGKDELNCVGDETDLDAESTGVNKNCILPDYPENGKYVVESNPQLEPGDEVSPSTKVKYICDRQFTSMNPYSICLQNGTWNQIPACRDPRRSFIGLGNRNREQQQQNKRCTLPDFPKNGKYSVIDGTSSVPGDEVDTYTILKYFCNIGYEITETNSTCLRNGTWSDSPSCNRMNSDGFECSDETLIDRSFVCDGYEDCDDGSDEQSCGDIAMILTEAFGSPCKLPEHPENGEYIILNDQPVANPGEMVPSSTRLRYNCDTYYAITNPISICLANGTWSDLPTCYKVCVDTEYECERGVCIPLALRCDSVVNCDNLNDEVNCEGECKPEEFKCRPGLCIPEDWKCDGENDCGDDADEQGCEMEFGAGNVIITTPPPVIMDPTEGDVCTLPGRPRNGNYVVATNTKVTTNTVQRFTILVYRCIEKYQLSSPVAVCLNNKWSSKPMCLMSCTLPKAPNVRYTCRQDGVPLSCSDVIKSKTEVKAECTNGFFIPDPDKYHKCRNGKIEPELPACKYNCGMKPAIGTPLIFKGNDAKRSEFPWHLAIYSNMERTKNDQPTLICGGTIITRRIALSAAHCFWDSMQNKLLEATAYQVIAGKYYRDFDNAEDSAYSYVQTLDLEEILVQEHFQGANHFYTSDIAVLIFEEMLEFSNFVSPACLDFKDENLKKFHDTNGVFGQVAGWGITSTEADTPTVLQVMTIPRVSNKDCKKYMPETWHPYLTKDKFCAGYINGTMVCRGDSGGGLLFRHKRGDREQWYLRGIVSVGAHHEHTICLENTYGGFISIYEHRKWIQEMMNEYPDEI